jgi:RHS repeat-associated protein
LYFGDFNGDGIKDVALLDRGNDKITVKIGIDGGGYNTTTYNVPVPKDKKTYTDATNTTVLEDDHYFIEDIYTADWNNDGNDDIVVHFTNDFMALKVGYIPSDVTYGYYHYDFLSSYSFNSSGFDDSAAGMVFQSATQTTDDSYQYYLSDFDNDGLTDILIVKNGSFYGWALNINKPSTSPIITLASAKSITISSIADIRMIDFDGDGQTEFLTLDDAGNGNIYKYYNNTFNVVSVNGSTSAMFFGKKQNFFTGDFNGDGKTDYLSYNNTWKIYYGTGSGFQLFTGYISNDLDNYVVPGAFVTQTMGGGPLGSYIGLCAGYELGNAPTYIASKTFKTASIAIEDLNNDGKSDIIYSLNGSVEFFISNGSSFSDPLNTAIFSGNHISSSTIQVVDLNNDGQKEIIFGSEETNYTQNTSKQYYETLFAGGVPPQTCTNGDIHLLSNQELIDGETNSLQLGIIKKDANGDYYYSTGPKTGKYLTYYYKALSSTEVAVHNNYQVLNFSNLNDNLYVNSITNGLQHTTGISFKILTNSEVKSAITTTSVTGVKEIMVPLKVVYNTLDNSTSGSPFSNTNYKYSKLRYNILKGTLGFGIIEAYDDVSKSNSITKYNVNPTFFVPYLSSTDNYLGATQLSNTNFTYSFNDKTSQMYFSYLSKKESTDNLTGITKSIALSQDLTDGYLTSKTEKAGSDVTIVTAYSGNTGSNYWQPTTITTTRTQNGDFVTNQGLTYDTYGNLLTSTDNDGAITTYTYSNDKTNIATVSNNLTNIVNTFYYDDTRRFVTKTETKFSDNTLYTYLTEYDDDGRPTRKVDKNGLVSACQYDGYGNKQVDLKPNGRKVSYSYGWASDASNSDIMSYSQSTEESGNSSTSYFDFLGRVLKKVAAPSGSTAVTTTYSYNNLGQITNETSSANGTTSYTYSSIDGLLQSVVSKGRTVFYAYSTATVTTTINGVATSKTYNAAGQVTSAKDGGGNISYTYHATSNPGSITTNGITETIAYYAATDPAGERGRQKSLTDPDAGLTSYTYDNQGRLLTQTDAKTNSTTMHYDAFGRNDSKTYKDNLGQIIIVVSYTYDPDNAHLGYLKKEEDSQSGISTSYTYDRIGQMLSKTDNIDGTGYTFNYEYDLDGKPVKTTYPDGFAVSQAYTGEFLNSIKDETGQKTLFNNIAYNARGQVTSYTVGNGNSLINTYDVNGFINSSNFGSPYYKIGCSYSFDASTMNLTSRGKVTQAGNQTESFTYDNLDRLTSWKIGNTAPYNINYAANGNIVNKDDMGLYGYNTSIPHAVQNVSQLAGPSVTPYGSDITYNLFNKVNFMKLKNSDGTTANTYTITYGPDDQRHKTQYMSDATPTIYSGLYEKRPNGDVLHYIHGPEGIGALLVTNASPPRREIYYLYSDYLGSLIAVEKEDGSVYKEFSYDPWGRRRNPVNWNDYTFTADNLGTGGTQLFTRGYTGHEYIDAFALINMNGRMYDPRLGRMLSPDNFVQSPDNSQSYNRYSYCVNNPLKYTDPSGNSFDHWYDYLNPMEYLSAAMQWVNNNTREAQQKMIKAGIPAFNVGISTNFSGSNFTGYAGIPNGPAISYNNNYGFGIGGYYPGYNTNFAEENTMEGINNAREFDAAWNYLRYAASSGVLAQAAGPGGAYSNFGNSPEYMRAITLRAFGNVPGLGNVYGNGEVPANSSVYLSGGKYITSEGAAWGFANGNNIYISPAAQQAGPDQMFSTISHELVHVLNFNAGLDMTSPEGIAQTEHAAWVYTETFARGMGWNSIATSAYNSYTYGPAMYNPVIVNPSYTNFSLPFH